jgi:hypothetical protein
MKKMLLRIGAAALLLFTISGCSSLLPSTASPTSAPVVSGIATTNDSTVVAEIKEMQAVNKTMNPTQTEPIIDAGLGGLAMMLTAFGGWYARHTTAKTQIADAKAATNNVDPPLKS